MQLYTPREVKVQANSTGEPSSVVQDGGRRRVVSLRNGWRVDDEWWREEIARLYYEVELDDGLVMTIFHDLVSGKWYRQRY